MYSDSMLDKQMDYEAVRINFYYFVDGTKKLIT